MLSKTCALLAVLLVFDWNIFPEWYLQNFVYYTKHVEKFNWLDNWAMKVREHHKSYNPKKDSTERILVSVLIILSIVLQ